MNTFRIEPTPFERALLSLGFRKWAHRRAQPRFNVAYQRAARKYFQGADVNRLTNNWREIGADPNDVWKSDALGLVKRARYLTSNNPHGVAIKQAIQAKSLGDGIKTQIKIGWSGDPRVNEFLNSQIEDTKRRWMDKEADGLGAGPNRMHYYDLSRLAQDTYTTEGEVLVLRRFIEDPSRIHPLAMEIISRDRLATFRALPEQGNEIIDGIEIDADGRKVAFHLEMGSGYRSNVQRFDARDVNHVYRVDRPGQARGISWYAPVIATANDLEDVKYYTLVARKVQNSVAALVTQNEDGMGWELGEDYDISETLAHSSIEPAMIHVIPHNAKVDTLSPQQNQDLPELTKLYLRAVGIGMGLAYEFVSGDWSDMNFAGGRLSQLNVAQNMRSTWGFHVRRFESIIHEDFIDAGFAAGSFGLTAPARGDIYASRYTRPPMTWGVNPMQEVSAAAKRLELGLSSLKEEIENQGGDFEQTMKDIQEGQAYADSLDLIIQSALSKGADTATDADRGMDLLRAELGEEYEYYMEALRSDPDFAASVAQHMRLAEEGLIAA